MSIKLYRKIQGESDTSYVLIDTVADGVETKSVTGLDPETTYVFKGIRSIDGVDSVSVTVTGVTEASIPTVISGGVAKLVEDYSTLTGATPPESDALTTFMESGEDSWLDYLVALYPLVGDSAANKRFNILDPVDADYAFRMNYLATPPLSDAKGLKWQGDDADVYINPSQMSGSPYVGGGFYAVDANYITTFEGRQVDGTKGNDFDMEFNWGGNAYINITASSGSSAFTPEAHKLTWSQREDDNTIKLYKDDVESGSITSGVASFVSNRIRFKGNGSTPVVGLYFILAKEMPSDIRTAFSTSVTTLMTSLGRTI